MIPQQDPVVVGVGDGQAYAVGRHGRGRAQSVLAACIGGSIEIRLPHNNIGTAAANRAPPVQRVIVGNGLSGSCRQLRRAGRATGVTRTEEVLVNEDAVILRIGAHAKRARIGHHQHAVGPGQAADGAQQHIAGIDCARGPWELGREMRLSDHGAGCLSTQKISREQRVRSQKENTKTIHMSELGSPSITTASGQDPPSRPV